MNRYLLLLISVLLFGGSYNSNGQARITGNTLHTPDEYYIRVKQFGEFIERFNYKSDWKGNAITEEFSKKMPRTSYILYLINAEDPRLSTSADSIYRKDCSRFISFVTDPNNPQTINLFSGQVTAWAKVNVIYGNKNYNVDVAMVPEVAADRSVKWVISKVEADCFASATDSLQQLFIAPNSHETSFINMKKISGSSNPIYFFRQSIATDPTLLFMTEVQAKRMKIQTIEQVTYHIAFPGWEITVDDFNRNTNNSGWLISNIVKN
jgi:hypothetical protein